MGALGIQPIYLEQNSDLSQPWLDLESPDMLVQETFRLLRVQFALHWWVHQQSLLLQWVEQHPTVLRRVELFIIHSSLWE